MNTGRIGLTRRRFLISTVFLAVAGVLATFGGSWFAPYARRVRHPIEDALTRLSPLRDELVGIGKRYLIEHPAIADTALISTRLRSRLDVASSAASIDSARALAQRIRTDFASGDVVTVDGWLLARTEAEFCALVALAER
jgi:hypothetical protein